MSATEQERRTTFLELFFDLVFVFAVTQVTALVLHDASAAGFARGTLALGLVWWAWSGYAWMTNAIDVESPLVRALMLAAAAGSFFLALGVPEAFADEALWFAAPYFAIRILNVALYLWGLRGERDHQRAMLKLTPWFLVAPAVALAGGFADDASLRTALWAASLAIDIAGTMTVGSAGFRVSPAHFAERYGLFIIIALGESIVAIGLGALEYERNALFALAVAIAFAGVAGLWWAYFDFVAPAAERTLRRADPLRRGPLARDVFTLGHFPSVLGIVFLAVAGEKTLAHPDEPLSQAGRAALGAGVALYLIGFALARLRAVRSIAWERLAGGSAALAAALALDAVDAVWTLAAVVAVLWTTIAVESARLREFRRELRSG